MVKQLQTSKSGEQIQVQQTSRSAFDLSKSHQTSCKMGKLVPLGSYECIPGDLHFFNNFTTVVRLSPLVGPLMAEVDVNIHMWFVPNRIIHDDWEDFCTGGEDGKDSSVLPYITVPVGGYEYGSLMNQLGFPAKTGDGLKPQAFPLRAYNLIYNEFYRQQDVNDKVTLSTASGSDTTTNTTLLNRLWERDRFVKALPYAQKGDSVTLPLGTTADIKWDTISGANTADDKYSVIGRDGSSITYSNYGETKGVSTGQIPNSSIHNMVADLSEATAATINEIRDAFALQKFLELNARAGSRYPEFLQAHFGVRPQDGRLQRPEYIGGSKSQIILSEVLQTSETGTTPQGHMAGHGISLNNLNGAKYYCHEHGYIIPILSIKPRTIYKQGIPRHFLKDTKFDYFLSLFEHQGEQPIFNCEVNASSTASLADPYGEFGYLPIFEEYRENLSTVSGLYAKDYVDGGFSHWTMARNLPTDVVLDADFLNCQPSTDPFASPNEDTCFVTVAMNWTAMRPIAKYGTPQGI